MLIIKIYQYCPGIVTSSLTSTTVPFHFPMFALWYNLISYRLAYFCRGNSIIIQLNMRITSGVISNGANLATLSAYHINNIRHYRFNLRKLPYIFREIWNWQRCGEYHVWSMIKNEYYVRYEHYMPFQWKDYFLKWWRELAPQLNWLNS